MLRCKSTLALLVRSPSPPNTHTHDSTTNKILKTPPLPPSAQAPTS
jgi:hypothetical protein